MCNIFSEASVNQFADDTRLLTADKNLYEAQKTTQHYIHTLIYCVAGATMWVYLVINAKNTKLMSPIQIYHTLFYKTVNNLLYHIACQHRKQFF